MLYCLVAERATDLLLVVLFEHVISLVVGNVVSLIEAL